MSKNARITISLAQYLVELPEGTASEAPVTAAYNKPYQFPELSRIMHR